MKRELGIARCGLACCLCSENVIATNVVKRAEKDCWVRSSPMPLQNSPEDMVRMNFWTALNGMRKMEWFITGRA